MKNMYKLAAAFVFAALFNNYVFGMDFSGDVNLSSDYNASGNIGSAPVNVNINGNGHSINGNGFSGLQIQSGVTKINLKNAGGFNLTKTDTPTEDSVIKLDENGNIQYYNITEKGSVKDFQSTSQNGSFIYNSNYSYKGEVDIENSVIKDNHINSSAKNSGGAIYNYIKGGDFSIKNSYITGNGIETDVSGGTISGGAIYNYISRDETGIFNVIDTFITDNKINAPNSINVYGGAIFTENSNLNMQNSYLGNNSVTGYNTQGGALFLEGMTASHTINKSVFENNKVVASNSGGGGAVYANNGNLTVNNSLFLSNKVETVSGNNNGGAISKAGGDNFTVINSVFENNSIEATNAARIYGGAIYAGAKENVIKNSVFKNNSAVNNTTSSGMQIAGGAIYLSKDTLKIDNSVFDSNKAISNQWSYGGAIGTSVSGNTYSEINNSTFINNIAESSAASSFGANGGAVFVYNNSVANINNSVFNGNIAKSAAENAYQKFGGGAVYVSNNSTVTIADSSFTDNKAIGNFAYGGAILNSGNNATLNIIADKKDVVFTGNQSGIDENSLTSNAIHNDKGIINLNAGDSKIIFNDRITSTNSEGVININNAGDWDNADNAQTPDGNKIPVSAPVGGTIVLNNNMNDYKGGVNLYGGTIAVGADGTFFEKASSFNVNGVSNLDLANGVVRDYNLGNLNLNADLNTAIDIDLLQQKADNIMVDTLTVNNDAKININRVNVTADANAETAKVVITEDKNLQEIITLDTSATTALGKIFKYNVDYDTDSATMSFLRSGIINNGGNNGGNSGRPSYNDLNPAVMVGAVAAQLGGYMGMLDTYNNAFNNMDMRMLNPSSIRAVQKLVNSYAISDTERDEGRTYFDNETNSSGTWVRPFAAYDTVGLKNGPKVNNFSYGTFIGGDTAVHSFNNGAEGVLSAHVSYLGSHQNFASNSIYQNGGNLGVTGTFYKGNFFSGLSINAGASVAEASTRYGNENFPMLMAGIANKTGYNIEFKEGRFIIQPSLLLSYTFVNTFDYTNAAGVKISGDPLHAIQISPNVRFALNTRNNWQPYLTAGMNWNIMNDSEFKANMTSLPDLSMKPYVQYGLGIQRTVNDNFTAYGQVLLRNGGRNGIAANAGFRYLFGHESKSQEVI